MTSLDKKAILSIASIFSLRMYGLFLIIPVFTLYASSLEHADELLVGIAFGIYGLTQGLMQIPFGALSDKYGRKRLITLGLFLFFLGSLMAAGSESIWTMIIARSLQGMGAIAAVTLALLADMTSEKMRTISMAIVGSSIGLMFMLGLITGPLLIDVLNGESNLFLLISALAILAMIILWTLVPKEPEKNHKLSVSMTSNIKKVAKDGFLLRCNIGIFSMHAALMCLFLVLPIHLKENINLANSEHGWLYFQAMIGAIVILCALMALHGKHKSIELKNNYAAYISIILMIIGFIGLILFNQSYLAFMINLTLFLGGFTMLEAMLPSTVSKYADISFRGAALGLFNSFEFTGIFFGGVIGGYLLKFNSLHAVYIFCIIMLSIWFIAIQKPSKRLPSNEIK